MMSGAELTRRAALALGATSAATAAAVALPALSAARLGATPGPIAARIAEWRALDADWPGAWAGNQTLAREAEWAKDLNAIESEISAMLPTSAAEALALLEFTAERTAHYEDEMNQTACRSIAAFLRWLT